MSDTLVLAPSGPTKRSHGDSYVADDGRWHHHLRQSTIETMDQCLERSRLDRINPFRPDTDATARGTAVHAGIETCLAHLMDFGEPIDLGNATNFALATWEAIAALPTFRIVKDSLKVSERFICRAVERFHDDLYHLMQPLGIEVGFSDLVIHQDEERVIFLSGTMDYNDAARGLIDWKTASDDRKYKDAFGGQGWELKRWSIQAPVYTFAGVELGLLDPAGPWDFTYGAFTVDKDASFQWLKTEWLPEHHRWLAMKCLSYAHLLEAQLPEWPRNDHHVLCSPKWCDHWASCKGAHVVTPKWVN